MSARFELAEPPDPRKDESRLGKGGSLGHRENHRTRELCATDDGKRKLPTEMRRVEDVDKKEPPIAGSDGGQAGPSRHLEGHGECYGAAADSARERKAWLTAQARATLAGFTAALTKTDDGRPELLVSRWALTRGFDCLVKLDAWLVRVGAKA